MRKTKAYEISVIDQTYSKTISDETKFYTSDTALELVFKLKETEYTFESAEIVLLNIDDRSLTTRPVSKANNDFVYELDDDIIPHYGEWRGQLMLVEKGELHVSSPFKFRIENDLYSNKPLEIAEVVSWVSLKKYANVLVDELKQAVDEVVAKVETMDGTFKTNELERDKAEKERQDRFEDAESEREKGENIRVETFETNETERQTAFETNESERDETFNTNEDIRRTQELEREIAENQRQNVFDVNEANRTETFNTNESTRQENETARQQAESQRQSTFETNETERQTTFETAEQERQSAEVIRVENEKQRNLITVDEFIKLQNAVGGRNYILNSDSSSNITILANRPTTNPLTIGVENGVAYLQQSSEGKFNVSTYVKDTYANNVGIKYSEDLSKYVGSISMSIDIMADVPLKAKLSSEGAIQETEANVWTRISVTTSSPHSRPSGIIIDSTDNPDVPADTKVYWRNIKIEKGTQATPYTKTPEDYTAVSKDDYYNHIRLMNEFKDNQFNQLRNAVITLGGTI